MARTRLREEEHLARALRHRAIGDAIAEAGDEWAAVPLFYSAYHRVKGALLRDPVWDDIDALHSLHADLVPDDRFTERHKGRKRPSGSPREWGLNELVFTLYRPIAGAYDKLHQASISVRYSTGLPSGSLPNLVGAIDEIETRDNDGDLAAPINWPKP